MEADSLTVDNYDFAICIKNTCDSLSDGIIQRDEAIKVDASGATTLLYESGRFVLPDHFDIEESAPEAAVRLREMFELQNGDLIIIGTASNDKKAEDGAFAAATWILSE